MKILVLGGNGFIGKNLCDYLIESGHKVASFDLIPPAIKKENISYITGNFFDDQDIVPYLKNIDIVFHAISTINPGNSNEKYMQGYQYDFLQSVKLCNWATQFNFRLIYLSSGGTVYGFQKRMPIEEERLSVPANHYGNLKLCIENTFRTFHKQLGTDIVIARIANPYGPGQDYGKGVGFIDAALKRALRHQTIEIWGDGTIIRDYIYIGDVCQMLASLVDYTGDQEVLNISSGKGTSQNEILSIIHKIIPDISVEYLPARRVDVPEIVLDNQKILEIYQKKCVTITEGISTYYSYLKDNFD